MINGKTDLVQYYRLVGETEEFLVESDRRIMEDINNNLVTIDKIRELKLKNIFNFE
jgi:hypothetical protein